MARLNTRRTSSAISGPSGWNPFGRQGGFDYQPTARVSTQEAETALGMARLPG
ncbi:MAG: hypothetical protein QM722_00600 [Piscinibacter sp.]